MRIENAWLQDSFGTRRMGEKKYANAVFGALITNRSSSSSSSSSSSGSGSGGGGGGGGGVVQLDAGGRPLGLCPIHCAKQIQITKQNQNKLINNVNFTTT